MTDIATVLKSLLDSSIPRQFLDLLEYTTVFRSSKYSIGFARVTDIATVFKSLLDSSIPRQFLDLLEHARQAPIPKSVKRRALLE